MKRLLFAITTLPIFAQALPAHAQQDSSPVDVAAILRELDTLEHKQKQTIESARQSAINTLRQGLGGGPAATNLYTEAIGATRFDGLKDKVSAFTDWKKKNAEEMRSQDFQTALRLHLRYLILSLERGNTDKPMTLAKPSMDYVAELVKAQADFKSDAAEKEILSKKINDSIFTHWLKLGPWLPSEKEWESSPNNVSGILEKNIRRPLREAKDPNLISVWDFEIQTRNENISKRGSRDYDANQFKTIELPKLQFARANDLVALGMNNRGITEIFALIKTNPQHPDFAAWLQRLRELLTPAEKEPPPPAPAP